MNLMHRPKTVEKLNSSFVRAMVRCAEQFVRPCSEHILRITKYSGRKSQGNIASLSGDTLSVPAIAASP
jgi:hypothetical protein